MTLRFKTLLIAAIAILIVILLVNMIGHFVIIDGFQRIEAHNVEKSLQNIQTYIGEQEKYLELKSKDWARWDDPYNYILGRNSGFIERNLTDDTFINLEVNLVVIADKNGKILFSRYYDYIDSRLLDVPEKFRSEISLDDRLISGTATGNPISGIAVIQGEAMLIASCPVTDSLQQASPAGNLIFGRRFDQTALAMVNRVTGENTSIYLKQAADLPEDVTAALSRIDQAKPIHVQTLDREKIAGYVVLSDLYGSPDIILKLESGRDIAAMGQLSYLYYLVASVLGALVTLVIAAFMLDRLIMRRIDGLNRGVKALADSGNHQQRLNISGSDEVGCLACQIDSMLATLEKSYQKIAEQEEKYRLVTDNISDIIVLFDMNMKILYFSPSSFRSRGFTAEEFMALPLERHLTSDSFSRAMRAFDDMLKMEAANPCSFTFIDIELQLYRKDGTTFWTENRFSPIRNESGKIVNILCVGRDISEKKLAQKQLLVQRDLAMKLSGATSMTEAIHTCIEIAIEATGFDCGVVYVIKDGSQYTPMCLTGFSSAYLEAISLMNEKSKLSRSLLAAAPVYTGKDDNPNSIGEAELKEGIVAYAIVPVPGKRRMVACLFIGSHKISYISQENRRMLEDISGQMGIVISRLKAEEELRESESKYQTLIESSANGVSIIQDGIYKYVNRTGANMLGYEREEIEGKPFLSLVASEWMEMVAERNRKRLTGQPAPERYEIGLICKDGSIKEVELFGSAISYEGKPATMAVITDLSEKKVWENRRLIAQKLESVGVLAGGIAHDFNNILAAILGNISLARLYNKQNFEVEEQLSKAEIACARAKGLTSQLLTFAKGGNPVKNTRSLIELLHDSTNFALSGSNVKAEFNINQNLWPVDIDVEQINHVIHNLIINASQAMSGGGIVKVNAENIIISENNSLSLPAGRFIEISIEDHGEGIPAQNIKYIFDPYFTTRQKGSGLGLAMTYSIIKNHGGTISVDSQVGIGTIFRVYLPASEQPLPGKLTEMTPSYSFKGRRVLLVDDEEMIRDVTSRLLKHMGIEEVLVAEDGREALRIYTQTHDQGQPVDAVIMDLTIPGGMGGKEITQEILKIDSNTRVIVSSGYASDPILSDYRKYGFKGMLTKPYRIQELQRVLGEVLSGQAD